MANELTTEELTTEEPTTEEIAKMYKSAQASEDMVNSIISSTERLELNLKHFESTVQSTYWTEEELKPFNDAITAGRTFLNKLS